MAHVPSSGAAVAGALGERWGAHLAAGEHFEVDVERTTAGIRVLAAVVSAKHERAEFDVEAEGEAEAAFDAAVDAADERIGSWLVEGRPRLRNVPEVQGLAGHLVRVVARTRRPDLEAEADRLLGEEP